METSMTKLPFFFLAILAITACKFSRNNNDYIWTQTTAKELNLSTISVCQSCSCWSWIGCAGLQRLLSALHGFVLEVGPLPTMLQAPRLPRRQVQPQARRWLLLLRLLRRRRSCRWPGKAASCPDLLVSIYINLYMCTYTGINNFQFTEHSER